MNSWEPFGSWWIEVTQFQIEQPFEDMHSVPFSGHQGERQASPWREKEVAAPSSGNTGCCSSCPWIWGLSLATEPGLVAVGSMVHLGSRSQTPHRRACRSHQSSCTRPRGQGQGHSQPGLDLSDVPRRACGWGFCLFLFLRRLPRIGGKGRGMPLQARPLLHLSAWVPSFPPLSFSLSLFSF